MSISFPRSLPNCVRRPAACATATAAALALAACSAPPVPRIERAAIPATAPSESIDPDGAAARAVLASPRVQAAAHRLDASVHRARAIAAPPDPTVALSLGVPLDGLGGSPISLSIMEGIAWLFTADQLEESAGRERTLAARELVAATVEVAAEARQLARALVAARDAEDAARLALDARAALARAEQAALELGESTAARVASRTRAELEARAESERTARRAEILALALASITGFITAPAVVDGAPPSLSEASGDSLEVLRARARLARAESALAQASGLGADSRAGAAVGRDLDDRDSANFTLELSLPIFRREHELAALRAEVDAERAGLDEAIRSAAVANAQAYADARVAQEAATISAQSAATALRSRDVVDRSHAAGEATLWELLEARSDAAEARIAAADRSIEFAQAIARLEFRSDQAPTQEARR